jgi:hypothetical protein
MIWYEQELRCKDQPDNVTLTLRGIHNEPGSGGDLIVIRLDIIQGDRETNKEIFTANPKALLYEEPTGDQVLAKYQHGISKTRRRIVNATYEVIQGWD